MAYQEAMAKFYERVDAHDFGAIDELCHEQLVVTTPIGVFEGRETYKAFAAGLYAALPDMRHVVTTWVEQDDQLAFQVDMVGRFINPLVTAEGEIPPTGDSVRLRGSDFLRFEDGQIKEWRIYFDPDVTTQLGMA